MTKKRKVFTAGLVILLVLASFPLAAYEFNNALNAVSEQAAAGGELPGELPGGPESPTSAVTSGLFTTDVDNVLHLIDWSEIEVEKSLGFAGWANNMFALGYAGKIGGIYLGTWYNGNVLAAGKTTEEFVDVTYGTNGIASTEVSGYHGTDTVPIGFQAVQPWVYTNNRLEVLVGIGNMGISLGARENYLSKELPEATESTRTENKLTGKVEGKNEISEYKYLKGWTDVYAGFGMPISMGGGGGLTLKPTVKLGVQLYTDDENTVYKGTRNNSSDPYEYTDIAGETKTGKNISFVRPKIEAGVFVSGLPLGLSASLDYAINFDIYTSSYGDSEPVAGTVQWQTYSLSNTQPDKSVDIKNDYTTIEEKTRLWQKITPALYWGTALGENVAFALGFSLPFTLGSETGGGQYTKHQGTTTTTVTGGDTTVTSTAGETYYTGESETSTFAVTPGLALGTQFAAIPNRLTVNLGLSAGVGYTSTTTRTKAKADDWSTETITVNGKVTKNEKTSGIATGSSKTFSDTYKVEESFSDLSTGLNAGITFYFNPNFLIDASYSSPSWSSSGGDDPTLGLDRAFTVMFTIKK